MLAIFIKTLRREEAFLNTITSIEKNITVPYRLYICDDGPVSAAKEALYERLEGAGHRIIRSDVPVSPSRSRVVMAGTLADEAYVLRMDDDFEVAPGLDLQKYIALMEADPSIGALSGLEVQRGNGKGVLDGQVSYAIGYFRFHNGRLYKDHVGVSSLRYLKTGSMRYAFVDFGRNFLLIRRAMLNDVLWDELVAFAAEHEDFFLQIKNSGRWKLAFVPEVTHYHRQDLSDLSDLHYRKSKNSERYRFESLRNFLDKWEVTAIRNRYTLRQKLTQYRVFITLKFHKMLGRR